MYYKYKLYVFDFDGTLTRRDTFIAFLRYVHGTKATIKGLLALLPWIVLMMLGIANNGKVKRMVFAKFFAGMDKETFDTWCRRFAYSRSRLLLRPRGMQRLREVIAEGSHVLVVTASINSYVQYFFDSIIADFPTAHFSIIATEPDVQEGKISGRFATKNCYGAEKLRRVMERYPRHDDYYLTVYGDSRGDLQMLDASDEGYYKPFRS